MSNKVIELNYVAQAFNKMLGADFAVEVNCMPRLLQGKVVPCTLQANRIPFAISNVKSETLEIVLTFYINVTTISEKLSTLSKIDKLIGSHSGEIQTYDIDGKLADIYKYNVFLQGNQPLTDPQFDMGYKCQSYTVSGTMLVTDARSGAVISNEIETFFGLDEESCVCKMNVLSSDVDPSKAVDNVRAFSGNKIVSVLKYNAVIRSYVILYCGTEMDKLFLEYAEGEHQLEYIYVRKVLGDNVVMKKCKILNLKFSERAGAYLTYSLALQDM